MKTQLHKGQQFGHWTILGAGKFIGQQRYYQCRCSCGTIKFVRAWNLAAGRTKGCPNCQGKRMQKPGLRTCPDCKGVKSVEAKRCLRCEGLRRRDNHAKNSNLTIAAPLAVEAVCKERSNA